MGVVLSVVWATVAYNYDQYTHEQMVAEASAQCADLDDKSEELECRRSWLTAIEKRLPLPSKQLSLATAIAPVPFAWPSLPVLKAIRPRFRPPAFSCGRKKPAFVGRSGEIRTPDPLLPKQVGLLICGT